MQGHNQVVEHRESPVLMKALIGSLYRSMKVRDFF